MTLKPKVVNVDLAKRMKELGCKQESSWYWSITRSELTKIQKGERPFYNWELEQRCWDNEGWVSYSAFTVAELGEKLHNDEIIRYIEEMGGLSITRRSLKTTQWGDKCLVYIIMDLLKSPNDMAKMWIYLKEEGLL